MNRIFMRVLAWGCMVFLAPSVRAQALASYWKGTVLVSDTTPRQTVFQFVIPFGTAKVTPYDHNWETRFIVLVPQSGKVNGRACRVRQGKTPAQVCSNGGNGCDDIDGFNCQISVAVIQCLADASAFKRGDVIAVGSASELIPEAAYSWLSSQQKAALYGNYRIGSSADCSKGVGAERWLW